MAKAIAKAEEISPDYVEQILLRLRRAGLVDSVRGARGGYLLARSPEDITVRDVVDASELGTFEVNCERHRVAGTRCSSESECSIRPVWQLLQRRIDETLDSIRLGDLLHEEAVVRDIIGLSTAAV